MPADIMARDVDVVRSAMSVDECRELLVQRQISGDPVVGDNGTAARTRRL
jgi:CBS-domain-containing membrane protein